VLQGFLYSRHDNPSRQILEQGLALLEDAKYSLCFSSGTSAISVVVQLLKTGDNIVSSEIIFGGTYRYFDQVRCRTGRQVRQEWKLLGSVLTAPALGQGFTSWRNEIWACHEHRRISIPALLLRVYKLERDKFLAREEMYVELIKWHKCEFGSQHGTLFSWSWHLRH